MTSPNQWGLVSLCLLSLGLATPVHAQSVICRPSGSVTMCSNGTDVYDLGGGTRMIIPLDRDSTILRDLGGGTTMIIPPAETHSPSYREPSRDSSLESYLDLRRPYPKPEPYRESSRETPAYTPSFPSYRESFAEMEMADAMQTLADIEYFKFLRDEARGEMEPDPQPRTPPKAAKAKAPRYKYKMVPDAQGVKQLQKIDCKPTGTGPIPTTDTPSLAEFMAVMKPRNPCKSEQAIRHYWVDHYAEKFERLNKSTLNTKRSEPR